MLLINIPQSCTCVAVSCSEWHLYRQKKQLIFPIIIRNSTSAHRVPDFLTLTIKISYWPLLLVSLLSPFATNETSTTLPYLFGILLLTMRPYWYSRQSKALTLGLLSKRCSRLFSPYPTEVHSGLTSLSYKCHSIGAISILPFSFHLSHGSILQPRVRAKLLSDCCFPPSLADR